MSVNTQSLIILENKQTLQRVYPVRTHGNSPAGKKGISAPKNTKGTRSATDIRSSASVFYFLFFHVR